MTPKFRELLEEYHRKQWFPQKYPDPFGEFIDYISEGMIRDLQENWIKTANRSLLAVAYYICTILPTVQFRDLFRLLQESMARPMSGKGIRSDVAFYYLRTLPDEDSAKVWRDLKEWTMVWESTLRDWLLALISFERKHSEFEQTYYRALHVDCEAELPLLERKLLESRDLFQWQIENRGLASDFRRLLHYFRFHETIELADWKDVPSLAKTVAERCKIETLPEIQQASDAAVLFLFPIAPPKRVILEYGKTPGPYDALRFLFKLGKGFFYSGMNPELRAEDRICGDPSLPLFWGFLYSHLLADRYSITNIVGYKAEALADPLRFALQFSYRYDTALALYRNRVSPDLSNAEDAYGNFIETAFPLEPPRFLYLYDLNRSSDSFFRVQAHRCAIATVDRLSSQYGKHWFSSQKLARRFRDYWWEGFRFSLREVMHDLDVSVPDEYPFYAP